MHDLGGNRGWQTGAHRGERVVEQQGVRFAAAVIAREPYLVHTVVEAGDPVRWHDFSHVGDQTLRIDRPAIVVLAFGEVLIQMRADFGKVYKVPMRLRIDGFLQTP